MHYCAYHKEEHEDSSFRIKDDGKLDSWCIEGRKENGREYSRKAYAAKKAENEAKRKDLELNPPSVKVCSVCKIEKPVEDFPKRGDRPGKRHAKCSSCLEEWRKDRQKDSYQRHQKDRVQRARDYRKDNPEAHRESVRKRAKRKRRVRREDYTRKEIRVRDQGLCWFCKEYVDPELVYPDPGAQVVHHIIPFSKRGPDAPSNVALAHRSCNAAHYNRCESPFSDEWSVKTILRSVARSIAKENHYLHRAPNVSFAFGLFQKNDLKGIVTFGTTSSWRINTSVCPEDPYRVIELNRLWIDPGAPFGAASWFVSRALKKIPPLIVVSYADTSVSDSRNKRKHDGSVYQALSFRYAGRSLPSTDWRIPGGTRNLGKKVEGTVPHKVSPKERYWTVTGSKKERRNLLLACEWPSFPYTERD